MKRILSTILAILILSATAVAQTYCYRQIKEVDDNGVQRQGRGHYVYITFVNNKSGCYISDANGNDKGAGLHVYKFTNNGIHQYEPENRLANSMMGGSWYRFNSDFSRYNSYIGSIKTTFVYERVDGESSQPVTMY